MSDVTIEDRRVARTRAALHQAFMDLVAERDYDDITIADVITRADVGRSTFYQHYSNKDEILRAVMAGGFAALADTVNDGPHLQYLEEWLQIFWNNRRAGRVLLSGQPRAPISRQLAEMVEERLDRIAALAPRRPPAPLRLVSSMIAESQLGLIQAWIAAQTAATPAALAETLRLAAQGLTSAMFGATA